MNDRGRHYLNDWEIVIDQLHALTRIGIYEHEREPQPVVINAVLHYKSDAFPSHIDDCLDYGHYCQLIGTYLDKVEQVDLLEQLVVRLLVFSFQNFPQLTAVALTVFKPNAVSAAKKVGICMHWSRKDYECWTLSSTQICSSSAC